MIQALFYHFVVQFYTSRNAADVFCLESSVVAVTNKSVAMVTDNNMEM